MLMWVHLLFYWGTVRVVMATRVAPYSKGSCTRPARVLFNQLVVLPTMLTGVVPLFATTPLVIHSSIHVIAALLVYDPLFYCTHRAMHALAMKVHTEHHAPPLRCGNALLMHPLDAVVSGFGPLLLAVLLCRCTFGAALVVAAVGSIGTVLGHAPRLRWSETIVAEQEHNHAVHHHHPSKNFGDGFFLLDRFFGTYQAPETRLLRPSPFLIPPLPPSSLTADLSHSHCSRNQGT